MLGEVEGSRAGGGWNSGQFCLLTLHSSLD